MIQAILFDLDGLMVDSEPHSIASWQAVLARRGVAFDQPTLDRILGLRLSETAQMTIDLFHLSDRADDLAREKTEYQITHLDGHVAAMPGLIELLDEIDRRSVSKAIASSGIRRYVQAVLKATQLTERFSTIVTGEDVINGKPAPDVFLKAAQSLNVDPPHCLVLEDAPAGVHAAKAANMMCIAVPNGHTRQLDLSLADEVLPSLSAVRDRLLTMA
jgi:HAD superfamily hydrolase (TIGR01509 family)